MLRFLRLAAALAALGVAVPAAAQDPAPAPVPAKAVEVQAAKAATATYAGLDATKPSFDKLDKDDPSEEAPSLLGLLLRMIFGLGFIVALIFVVLNYGARKLLNLGPNPNSVVRVHERVPLEPKKSVYVVEVAGEYLLLGVGEHEVSLIKKLEDEPVRIALSRREKKAPARPFLERLMRPVPKPSVVKTSETDETPKAS